MIAIHQPIERHFRYAIPVAENQAIFRRNQLERPGVVRFVLREVCKPGLKPLGTPGASFKPRTSAKHIVTHPIERTAEHVSRNKRWFIGTLPIDKPIDTIN